MPETKADTQTLYMVQMWLEMKRLVELARALHLPLNRTDDNYITHCALKELFGDIAPAPFSVEKGDARHLRVLGYCSVPLTELQIRAREYASPLGYEICNWDRLASKPMPDRFTAGTRLQFKLRACPVVRKSSEGKYHSAGTEVDAFLSRVWEVDDPEVDIDRAEVYNDWLQDQFARRGGAKLLSSRLKRFSIERMVRRAHEKDRTSTVIKRPDSTLEGQLEVTEPEAFQSLLKKGIGRHTSFGFGMLKVRPAGS
ncbi:MAG: type I-E CRISPR-associated protein Cas6/Cse3/CasE [Planctomycetes bacterium]|nr:type I-E CRISPR-associated protein Cas6/Cse3/CasE [Planctomycetota bacterium]